MGVLTFVVSDRTKEFFALGKLWLSDTLVSALHAANGPDVREALLEGALEEPENEGTSACDFTALSTWMRAHPDWRFVSEQHEEDVA